jgi:hypothetical protein
MMKLQELNIKIWDHAKVLLILFVFLDGRTEILAISYQHFPQIDNCRLLQ